MRQYFFRELLCCVIMLGPAVVAFAQKQVISPALSAVNGGDWDDRFGALGLNGPVHAIAAHDNKIYVGGYFSQVGNIAANNIAMWDGENWQALGAGISTIAVNAMVYAIAITPNGDVFVAGQFSQAGEGEAASIARWNGATWSQLASGGRDGVNNTVYALAVIDNEVYACGLFSRAGNLTVNGMAKWDGAQWTRLGTSSVNGVTGGAAYALLAHDNELYAGGDFSRAGAINANRIAKWHPARNEWTALDRGIDGPVYALAANDSGEIFAGGAFSTASGIVVRNLAKWEGSAWSSLGAGADNGVSGPVRAVAFKQSLLFVGGDFREAGSTAANFIAKWNGSNWSPLGSGVSGMVHALAHSGSEAVYAGGQFQTAGGQPSHYFGIWREQTNAVAGNQNVLPGFALHQNFPNPFNPATVIRFTLARPQWVSLKIYDIQGREAARLHEGLLMAGEHVRYWQAQGFRSGVYLCRLTAGGFQETRKLLLVH